MGNKLHQIYQLKMQNDRININFGKQSIEYMVI